MEKKRLEGVILASILLVSEKGKINFNFLKK